MRYRDARPLLPAEARVTAPDGSYRFGIPWPWEALNKALLRDAVTGERLPHDQLPDVAIQAPRTDGRSCLFTVRRLDEPVDLENSWLDEQLAGLAKQYAGQPGRIRRVRVGGARAVLLPLRAAQDEYHMLIADAGSRAATGMLRTPSQYATGYVQQFETVLGTWEWFS